MRAVLWCGCLAMWMGCSGKSSDDDSAVDSGSSGTTDTSDSGDSGTTDPGGFPDRPDAFTINVSGAYEGTLTFDTPTCSHRTGSTTFRQFWRGPDHVFVLLVEMFDTFPGETGSYTGADGVRAKLQEEAGGAGHYFDSTVGDNSASLTLEGFDTDANEAWGTGSVGTLGDGAGGTATISPDVVPIWCDSME